MAVSIERALQRILEFDLVWYYHVDGAFRGGEVEASGHGDSPDGSVYATVKCNFGSDGQVTQGSVSLSVGATTIFDLEVPPAIFFLGDLLRLGSALDEIARRADKPPLREFLADLHREHEQRAIKEKRMKDKYS